MYNKVYLTLNVIFVATLLAAMYFNLKEPKSNKPTLIILRYYINSEKKRFQYSTKIKINPKDWSFENKLPKTKRGRSDLQRINVRLSKYSNLLTKQLENSLLNDEVISVDYLKELFNTEFQGTKTKDFFSCFDLMVQEKYNTNQISKASSVKYATIRKLLEEYQGRNSKLDFSEINNKFYNQFTEFSYIEKKHLANTLGKNIGFIKSFMRWAEKKGYHNNKAYQEFNKPSNPVDNVALTFEEVMTLYNHDFKHHQKTVDLFLIGCFSGQRFVDYTVFDKSDLQDNFIVKRSKKTGTESYIPVNKYLKSLLDKYDWKLPKISNQKFNNYIKLACKEIEMDQPFKKINKRGAESEVIVKPKYMYISSHTARRTFITLALQKGMTYKAVMNITGIKKIETLLIYDKVNKQNLLEQSQRLWG